MGDMMALFDISMAWLVWGVVFSAVGLGYFMYGKRRHFPVWLWSGIALLVYPVVVSDTYVLVIVGAALMALPFIFKPQG